jgi:protein SYS1
MFYGAMVWDPWLIVSQIVCLQCLYYLTLGVLMSLLVGTRVPRLTLFYLFDFATLTPRIPTGWCVIVSFILAAIAGYAAPPLDTAQSSSSFSLRTPGIMLV